MKKYIKHTPRPGKHDHYSQEVRDAIERFNALPRYGALDLKHELWYDILRLRRLETGIGAYLTPDQYREVVEGGTPQ